MVKPKGPSGHCFSLFAVSFSDQSAVVAIVSPRLLGRSGAGGISSCGFIFSSFFHQQLAWEWEGARTLPWTGSHEEAALSLQI